MSIAKQRLFHEVPPPSALDEAAPVLGLARPEATMRSPEPMAPVVQLVLSRSQRWWQSLRERAPALLMASCSLLGIVLFWHFATTYKQIGRASC